jgi:hypothetical protein
MDLKAGGLTAGHEVVGFAEKGDGADSRGQFRESLFGMMPTAKDARAESRLGYASPPRRPAASTYTIMDSPNHSTGPAITL